MFEHAWMNLVMYFASVLLAGGLGASLTYLRASRKFDYTIRLEKDRRQQILLTVGTYVASLRANVPSEDVDEHVADAVSKIAEINNGFDHADDNTESFAVPSGAAVSTRSNGWSAYSSSK